MKYILAAVAIVVLAFGGWAAYLQASANYKIIHSDTSSWVVPVEADHDRPDHEGIRPASDDSIAAGSSWKVNCGTVDGGTSTDLLTNVDGGKVYDVSDYTVTSSSTTCVNVGLNSFVDTAHGVPVGSGCNGGTILSMHARLGRCRSTGAAVTVDVTGGRQ